MTNKQKRIKEYEYHLAIEPSCCVDSGHDYSEVDKDAHYRYNFCGCGTCWREPRGSTKEVDRYYKLDEAEMLRR